jgi:hypothetical protein
MIQLEIHIEHYLEEIRESIRSHPLLKGHPPETIDATCRVLAYGMRPIVDVLKESEEQFIFKVISPALATYLGGCLGNDTNSDRHTGEAAVTQSNAIIGICTDAVMRSLKGSLLVVAPLNFREALPIGSPVFVTITVTKRGKLTKGTIVVATESGKTIMREAELVMSRL